MNTISKKLILSITCFAFILFLLKLISPLLILYYAEEQYFVDKYKQNKEAFAHVKNDLLYVLKQENVNELKLAISYDSNGKRLLHDAENNDTIISVDANADAYNLVAASFGDFYWDKVYISENYIDLSVEGNNYQYVYAKNRSPETRIYASGNNKIRKLGNDWYLIIPK